jgi:hypothetical protein
MVTISTTYLEVTSLNVCQECNSTFVLVLCLRNILRSIIIALPLVTAVYLMVNIAYMTVLTAPEMIAAPAVAVVITASYL